MVIVIREDLKMTTGKSIAQACHAALGAVRRSNQRPLIEWELTGTTKIALGCNSLDELNKCINQAADAGLTYAVVVDAGRTEIPSGSMTCCAIGPADGSVIDNITGHLKLYKGK